MVSQKEVIKQLKKLDFNPSGWGRSEVNELHHVLLPDEQIYELVNGFYEDGFALLVATDVRVLLVDKKPLNYLTVEDLRFDMINEIDYSHRLMGARISIATGSKNLKFSSYNQQRLRKLINHVQDCMATTKRKESTHREGQVQHLERINEQLQKYLKAQHEYQEKLQSLQTSDKTRDKLPDPVKPSPELADFLYAQGLMAQYKEQVPQSVPAQAQAVQPQAPPAKATPPATASPVDELYAEGVKEIFGKHSFSQPAAEAVQTTPSAQEVTPVVTNHRYLDINPITIAYSKLPMALRNRKFGRPSFHAHSGIKEIETPTPATVPSQPVKA